MECARHHKVAITGHSKGTDGGGNQREANNRSEEGTNADFCTFSCVLEGNYSELLDSPFLLFVLGLSVAV